MYNDFIIIGPKENPAGINKTDNPITALTKIIYNSQALSSSSGDESGTITLKRRAYGKRPIWTQLNFLENGIERQAQAWEQR